MSAHNIYCCIRNRETVVILFRKFLRAPTCRFDGKKKQKKKKKKKKKKNDAIAIYESETMKILNRKLFFYLFFFELNLVVFSDYNIKII